MKLEKQKILTLLLFTIYFLALTWLILFKLQFSIPDHVGRVINLVPLLGSFDDNGTLRFSEIRANILAFIPLGIYICMIKTSWPFVKKMLTIVGLTFVYELIQFIFAIGRTDITDLLSNTLGGIIGIGVYALLSKVLKDRTNQIINGLAAVFTIAALLLVALLLISHRWVMIR
ncbi:VanZ family protein [Sporolactobacillus sp. STCC-11]|uniref:VanZ family protein n=1 Tax=Sporolactobacillus caesalpiniae TaxID=3230362 RepID=UPI0033989238